MDEVDKIPRVNSFQHRAFALQAKAVPANMGNFKALRLSIDGDDAPADKRKPVCPGKFHAVFKQKLHAKANAKQRFFRPALTEDLLIQASAPKGSHGIWKSANARQNQAIRSL